MTSGDTASAGVCPPESTLFRFSEGLLTGPELEHVEQHLGACERCAELLALAADDTAHDGAPPPSDLEAIDQHTIGRYVVLERLGSGAMGVVTRAYDPKLQREVALKQLRASLGSAESERLVREGRALAQLNHPHVVAVHDVEFGGGQPAIVMEMIRGQTLNEWLSSDRRWTDVLRCLRSAGQGLSAAHEAGLLHRDFKPANVMVGDDGRVRVTDFGIAGNISPRADDSSTGGQTSTLAFMGTPAYMAPEQHRERPLSHAADQYAFALTAREALTGVRPFSGTTLDALESAKRSGPPPWPGSSPWPRKLEIALDRAMHPDPDLRFPSMNALLAALRLRSSPLRALRWGLVVAGFGGVVAGLANEPGKCLGAEEALAPAWSRSKHEALHAAYTTTPHPVTEELWSRLGPEVEAYAAEWTSGYRDACTATHIRGEQSEALLDKRMACLGRARRSLRATVSVLSDGDRETLQRGADLVGALPPLAVCADRDYLERATPPPTAVQAPQVEAVRARLASARMLQLSGSYPEARSALEDAKQMERAGYQPLDAEVYEQDASLLEVEGRYSDAATALEHGVAAAARDRQSALLTRLVRMAIFLGARQGDFDRADAWTSVARGFMQPGLTSDVDAGELDATLGAVSLLRGAPREAEEHLRSAIAALETTKGPRSLRVAHVRSNLATCLLQAGNIDAAIEEYRQHVSILEERLGPSHPTIARTRQTLGNAQHAKGNLAEALSEHQTALEGRIAALGHDHPEVADSYASIAGVMIDLGRLEDAKNQAERAVELSRKHHGDSHRATLVPRAHLARIARDQGRHQESVDLHRALVRDGERVLVAGSPQLAIARANLGHALLDAGHLSEAEEVLRASVEERTGIFGVVHRQTVESILALASCQSRLGEVETALTRLRELDERVAAQKDGEALRPHIKQRVGEILLDAGRFQESADAFEAASEGLLDEGGEVARGRALFGQAKALERLGERSRAVPLASEARTILRALGPAARADLDTVTTWLADRT